MKNKQSNPRHEFSNWLNARINSAAKPETTPARDLLDRSFARGQYYRTKHAAVIEQKALDQQKADPSDPFVADRVRTHLRSGVAELPDYNVNFKRELKAVENPDTGATIMSRELPGQPLMRNLEVPHSVKHL